MEGGGVRVEVGGFVSGRVAPRRLRHEPRNAVEDDTQDARVGTGCRQMQADLGFHLEHPRGDLDEAQTQRVAMSRCLDKNAIRPAALISADLSHGFPRRQGLEAVVVNFECGAV